ncbi:MAG: DUF1819 family protein [Bacteroidota bacterium]
MTTTKKYTFGFNAASLRLNEMINIEKYAVKHDLDKYDKIEDKSSLIGRGKSRTSEREFHELKKRLEKLSIKQKSLLLNGDLSAQKQIAFLGVCKHYRFIRDFVVEVIREKFSVFDYQLSEGDYLTFFRRQQESNPELERLAETTFKKAKQVLWKILEQSDIIDDVNNKNIQPQLLNQDTTRAIIDDNPEWLKIYMLSDAEIHELKETYGKN